MHEIPPVKDTDAEDVVWGLQTADTLWKRGERIDALVWLRRAAQAAGDANDDDRALELARHAAELTESIAPSVPPPPVAENVVPDSVTISDSVDVDLVDVDVPQVASDAREEAASVLPAERVHAGMFDPWAEQAAAAPPPKPKPARPPSVSPSQTASGLPTTADPDDDEVITSVQPASLAAQLPKPALKNLSNRPPAAPPAVPPPKAPPPLPPRARPPALPVPVASKPAPPPAPVPVAKEPTPPPPAVASEPPPPPPPVASAPPPVVSEPAPPPVASAPPVAEEPASSQLDLDSVDAFSDLPDDARTAFAAAATIQSLAEGEEIGAFALAYVLSGRFDVAATVVDAPAVRLDEGAVLRARGTTDENVPIRLISAVPTGIIATWSDAAVEEAFRSIPWVEDDLRAAADRVQTLVGITIGPLGERLDVSIREEIVRRLTMRPLLPGEVVVEAGQPVPGLLLVGIGELELVSDGKVIGSVSSGDFLFATEVLAVGSAPSTARAGAGGALVLFGDRGIAEELLMTCPPLLEVFAGM